MDEFIYKDETYSIIGACMEVHNEMGRGFAEILYKGALEIEFRKQGIPFDREVPFHATYKGVQISHDYFVDFLVYEKIILEIKSVKELVNEHTAQVLNYLKLSGCQIGLLVNFNSSKLEYKRLIF